jgi:hypothetical protein
MYLGWCSLFRAVDNELVAHCIGPAGLSIGSSVAGVHYMFYYIGPVASCSLSSKYCIVTVMSCGELEGLSRCFGGLYSLFLKCCA